MKNLLLCAIISLVFYESNYGMNLEQSFNTTIKGKQISWEDIAEKTQNRSNSSIPHAVDVESAYGGGEIYDSKIVCEQALEGDCVAQYSLYRHIKNNDFVAYMMLCISAIFGKFRDSFDEARSLGIELGKNETIKTLRNKIANLTGLYV